MQYTVIFAKTRSGYGAHAPDLPGCIATSRTLAITRKRMREAIVMHLEGMKEDGLPIPKPTIVAEQVQVDAA
jgi:predicted RNase H-like HicB family nuclease